MSQSSSVASLCPADKLIEDYKDAVKDQKTLDEMSADQAWVEHHVHECHTCKSKL